MFEERRVFQFALGTQHVVALAAGEGSDGKLPPLQMSEFELAPGALPPKDDEDVVSQVSKTPAKKDTAEKPADLATTVVQSEQPKEANGGVKPLS
jgi:hypothetical protein